MWIIGSSPVDMPGHLAWKTIGKHDSHVIHVAFPECTTDLGPIRTTDKLTMIDARDGFVLGWEANVHQQQSCLPRPKNKTSPRCVRPAMQRQ